VIDSIARRDSACTLQPLEGFLRLTALKCRHPQEVQRTGMVSLILQNLTIESCGVAGAPCPMQRQSLREGLADRALRHPDASCRSMASNGGADKALMILDEVQAGLGRSGTFFCHEQFGITPDIITVSKALSGGYVPVGAMLSTAAVSDSMFSSMDRAVVHSSTFSNNQLAMVAGLATLAAFDDEDILDRVQRTGKAFTKALGPLVERYEFLHEVRGRGLMIGLVFGEPSSPGLRRRFRMIEAIRPALFSQMIVVPLFHRHRILTQVAADNMNVIKLLPPLIAGDDEVELFADALDDVLASAQKGSSLIFEFGKTMARGTLHRARL